MTSKPFVYVPPSATLKNSAYHSYSIFVCWEWFLDINDPSIGRDKDCINLGFFSVPPGKCVVSTLYYVMNAFLTPFLIHYSFSFSNSTLINNGCCLENINHLIFVTKIRYFFCESTNRQLSSEPSFQPLQMIDLLKVQFIFPVFLRSGCRK